MASVSPAGYFCRQNLGVFQPYEAAITRALNRVDFKKRTKVGNYYVLDQVKDPVFPEQGKYKDIFFCTSVLQGEYIVHVAARESINSPQFKKEKKVLSLLSGTRAIVPSFIYCVELHGYIISELYNRGSLARFIEQPDFIRGALSTHLLAYKIVCALGECHVRGIVLRDFKASNMVVREFDDGALDVRLIDFGMAYIKNEDSLSEATRNCGSRHYISSEEREQINLTGKTFPADFGRDLWALGSVMHGLVTKQLPPDNIEEVKGHLGLFESEIIDLVYSRNENRPPLFSIQERMFNILKKTFPNAVEIQDLALVFAQLPSTPKWAHTREVSYPFEPMMLPLVEPTIKPTWLERIRACFCCCKTIPTTI